MVDHSPAGWFPIVGDDGRKHYDTKSPPGKVDYHTISACWDLMTAGGLDA